MNNTVYIIEFKNDPKSWVSKLIGKFTKQDYSHTGIFFHNTFYDVTFTGKINGYNAQRGWSSIKDYLKNNVSKHRTVAYKLPKRFPLYKVLDLKAWWEDKVDKKVPYGFLSLFLMIFRIPLRGLMLRYYLKHKKPFPPVIKLGTDTCTMAVDTSIKEELDYDCFPKVNERVVFPGLYAELLRDHEVIV